jgi:hypothetical protein
MTNKMGKPQSRILESKQENFRETRKAPRRLFSLVIFFIANTQIGHGEPASELGYYRGERGEPYQITSSGSLQRTIYPFFGPTNSLLQPPESDAGNKLIKAQIEGPTSLGAWPGDENATITAIAASTDGRNLAIASSKGQIEVFDSTQHAARLLVDFGNMRISHLALGKRRLFASVGNSSVMIDLANGKVLRLTASPCVDLFLSEREDRLGIISFTDDGEMASFDTSIYEVPSGNLQVRLNGLGGNGGMFAADSGLILKSTNSGGSIYSKFEVPSGNNVRISGSEAFGLMDFLSRKATAIPVDLSTWGKSGLIRVSYANQKIPSSTTPPALPPIVSKDARKLSNRGIGLEEGAELLLDGRPVTIFQALVWQGKPVILFQPQVDRRYNGDSREDARLCLAILGSDCRPMAIFQVKFDYDLPEMAIAGDKLILLSNTALVQFDSKNLKPSEYRYEMPQSQNIVEVVGANDGSVAALTVDDYNHGKPYSVMVFGPDGRSIVTQVISESAKDTSLEQASLASLGDSYLLSCSYLYRHTLVHISLTGAIQSTATIGTNDRDFWIPVSTYKSGNRILATYWLGGYYNNDGYGWGWHPGYFFQITWDGKDLTISNTPDGRERKVPPRPFNMSGKELKFGGEYHDGIFLARSGKNGYASLRTTDGDFDSLWFCDQDGDMPVNGVETTLPMESMHYFMPRGFGKCVDNSWILAGSLSSGTNSSSSASTGVIYRVSKEDFCALGKGIDIQGRPGYGRIKDSYVGEEYFGVESRFSAATIVFSTSSLSIAAVTNGPTWKSVDSNSLGFLPLTPALSSSLSTGILNDSSVRLRSAPSTLGDILAKLDQGTQVKILGRSASMEKTQAMEAYWLKVQLADSRTGWVFSWFVDSVDPIRFDVIAE